MNKNRIIEIKLAVILAITIAFGMVVVRWSKEPSFRPLIQDINMTDAITISDVLDQNKIHYKSDVTSRILYVNQNDSEKARIALAKHGIVIDYPEIAITPDLDEAYNKLLESIENEKLKLPFWEQEWFMKQVIVLFSVLSLVLFVIRPIISYLTKDHIEK